MRDNVISYNSFISLLCGLWWSRKFLVGGKARSTIDHRLSRPRVLSCTVCIPCAPVTIGRYNIGTVMYDLYDSCFAHLSVCGLPAFIEQVISVLGQNAPPPGAD